MAENERQYKITRAQLGRLEKALEQASKSSEKLSPKLREGVVAGIQSQIEDLKTELREYEDLKAKKVADLFLESLAQLGEILIKARLARGYTQAELAERLNLKPQQIQKYEVTRYESARFRRVVDITSALEIDIQSKIDLRKGKHVVEHEKAPDPSSKAGYDLVDQEDQLVAVAPGGNNERFKRAAELIKTRGLWGYQG